MELPRLKTLWEKYHDQGFEIIAVEVTDSHKAAQAFIKEHALPYIFLDDNSKNGKLHSEVYNVFAYPTTFVIDRNGKISYYHLGFVEGDEVNLEMEIVKMLKINLVEE